MDIPGLVSREVIAIDGNEATVREIWDPRVPGCPMLVFKPYTFPFERVEGVESVTHTFRRPID